MFFFFCCWCGMGSLGYPEFAGGMESLGFGSMRDSARGRESHLIPSKRRKEEEKMMMMMMMMNASLCAGELEKLMWPW